MGKPIKKGPNAPKEMLESTKKKMIQAAAKVAGVPTPKNAAAVAKRVSVPAESSSSSSDDEPAVSKISDAQKAKLLKSMVSSSESSDDDAIVKKPRSTDLPVLNLITKPNGHKEIQMPTRSTVGQAARVKASKMHKGRMGLHGGESSSSSSSSSSDSEDYMMSTPNPNCRKAKACQIPGKKFFDEPEFCDLPAPHMPKGPSPCEMKKSNLPADSSSSSDSDPMSLSSGDEAPKKDGASSSSESDGKNPLEKDDNDGCDVCGIKKTKKSKKKDPKDLDCGCGCGGTEKVKSKYLNFNLTILCHYCYRGD